MGVREIALEYVDNGWSVLPVKPEEKRPFMMNWLQFTKTRPSKNMVDNWFSNLSGAGVGVVTGRISGMVVLDVENTCPIPIKELLKKYPTQMVARSGSGGYHLYYQYPLSQSKVSNRVRIFEGADLRADGGFIVLPPTIHPNGKSYEWVSRGPLGAFPTSLLDIQSQPKVRGDGWITETLRGVSEGRRNDACARLAGYFFSKGMAEGIVETLLLDWNERNEPPLPIKEVRATLKSIERNHTSTGLKVTGVQFNDDKKTEEQSSTFGLIKMSDYIRGYGGEVTWLVDDWLPDGSITFLISPPESYKTWLLIDLAVSVSTGLPFLGSFKVQHPGPILFIQQEDSHTGLTDRMALIASIKTGGGPNIEGQEWVIPSMPDIPVYIHPDRQLRFDNKQVLEELEQQISEIRPKVVLIDPLYSTTAGVDNYMADLANRMMVLKTWRDKYGCSFVIAHHSKKNLDPDSTAREDSWGSQFLNAFLEAGWQIRRNQRLAQNEVIVRRHSKVMGNQSPVSLTFNISTKYPLKYEVQVQEYQPQTQGSDVRRQPAQSNLLDLMQDGPMTQAEIVNRTGKGRSTISRQMRQLEAAGAVEHMPDGKWKVKN